jgi:PAS domain S-box-containing protein
MNKIISDHDKSVNEIRCMRERIAELEERERYLTHLSEQRSREEQKFRLIFERSLDGILLLEDGCFIDCNDTALGMLGFSSKEELMSLSPAELSPLLQPDGKTSAKKAEELIEAALDQGGARFEWVHKKKDGSNLDVEVLLTAIPLSGKNVLYTVWRDISIRRSAEQALVKSEERYSQLFKNIPDGIAVFSMDGRITEANKAFQEMIGYQESELRRLCHHDIVPEIWHDFENQVLREQVLVRGYSDVYQTEYIARNGHVFPVEVVTFLIKDSRGRNAGIWALVRNIEARKKAENELQQSEERFRALAEYAPFGLSIMNLDQTFDYFNPEFTSILGYTLEDLPDKTTWFEKAYPDEEYRAQVRQTWRGDYLTFAGSIDQEPRVFKVTGKDLKVKVIRFRAVFLGDGRQLLTYEDITHQKKAEEELIRSEEKYRSILDNIEEGYYETDLRGDFTFFNEALCEILGYTREELIGVNNRSYLDESNAQKVFSAFNQVYRTGLPTKVFDWEFITSWGEKHYVEASIGLRLDDSGLPVGFRGIARDVTERKVAEKALNLQKAYAEELIENAPEAIVLLDTSDVVLRINTECEFRMNPATQSETWRPLIPI